MLCETPAKGDELSEEEVWAFESAAAEEEVEVVVCVFRVDGWTAACTGLGSDGRAGGPGYAEVESDGMGDGMD